MVSPLIAYTPNLGLTDELMGGLIKMSCVAVRVQPPLADVADIWPPLPVVHASAVGAAPAKNSTAERPTPESKALLLTTLLLFFFPPEDWVSGTATQLFKAVFHTLR